MTIKTPAVISFNNPPIQHNERCLADLPDRVVAGAPSHVTDLHYESADSKLMSGTWTSTPGKWHAFADRDEFCYIVSGHCRLISDVGDVSTFRSGDAFLIPNGFRGYWEVLETTTKHFVIRHYQ